MDMGFVKFPFVRGRASCMFVRMYYYSVILQSHVTFLLVSPESGVPPYFNYLVSTHVNNTRRRIALLPNTFSNSRGCPLRRLLTVSLDLDLPVQIR